MNDGTTRRAFLHGGALATAGLLASETTAVGQESHSHHEQEHAGHSSTEEYPRDRPSPGGPVGSPTDRGMLVPGLRTAGQPPVPVIVPDLPEKLGWRIVDGAEVFRPMAAPVLGSLLIADEVADVFLPVLYFAVCKGRWRKLHGITLFTRRHVAERLHEPASAS